MPPVCGCVYVRGDVIYTITTQKVHQRPGCHITPYGIAMASLHNPLTCTAHPPTCTAMVGVASGLEPKIPRQQKSHVSKSPTSARDWFISQKIKKSRRLCVSFGRNGKASCSGKPLLLELYAIAVQETNVACIKWEVECASTYSHSQYGIYMVWE